MSGRSRRRALGVAFVLGLLPLAGIALAGGGRAVAGPPRAPALFQGVDWAIAAGYTLRLPDLTGETCIADATLGAMGVHMVNTGLLDATLDVSAPEALVYEPRRNGRLNLVAFEYVVFESDWAKPDPPELFGQEFDYVPAGNRYGLPAFYALHVWLWKHNPSGLFSAWNPRVSCD